MLEIAIGSHGSQSAQATAGSEGWLGQMLRPTAAQAVAYVAGNVILIRLFSFATVYSVMSITCCLARQLRLGVKPIRDEA